MPADDVQPGVAVDLVRCGAFRPLVGGRYPLADLAGAQRRFATEDVVGNLVVEP